MKKNSQFTKMIQGSDDASLLRMYHSYPILSTIFNLIITTVFILAFTKYPWLLLVGAALVFIIHLSYPNDGRAKIADLIMERHKKPGDTQASPYYYLTRLETRMKGSYHESVVEKIFIYISLLLRIVNYLFNLLSALICVLLTGILALIFGSGLYLFAIIANSPSMIELAKFVIAPFKWSVGSFLAGALVPGKLGGVGASGKFEINEAQTPIQQNLSFKNYFRLEPLQLPSATARLSTDFYGTSVIVSGTVYASTPVYENPQNFNELKRKVHDLINDQFQNACQRFHAECPDAGHANIKLNIQYVLN